MNSGFVAHGIETADQVASLVMMRGLYAANVAADAFLECDQLNALTMEQEGGTILFSTGLIIQALAAAARTDHDLQAGCNPRPSSLVW